MCNNVIINRLKALQRYTVKNNALWDAEFGQFILISDIQEIIDEFEVKE